MLAAVAFIAFACEATAGFGGTVLALALGAQLRPLDELLAIFIPANLILSLAMVVRHFAAVDRRLLLGKIAPAMIVGMPLGLVAARYAGRMVPLFAVVVMALGALELYRLLHDRGASKRGGTLLLILAGVVHGAWGTGGPLVVFVAGRDVADKQAFRSTLAVLWLVLNAVLLGSLIWGGQVTRHTLTGSLSILPVVVLALLVGEWAAARVSERPFRALGAALLGAAGVLLMVRGS